MWNFIVNTLDRFAAVVGALIFSQAPMFIDQYTSQLRGHLAELQYQINAIKEAAHLSGKDLNQFIQKFITNGDIDFVRQGEIMQKMSERYESISLSYLKLHGASPFTKPFVFLSNIESDIVKSTYANFHLGLQFSIEGIIYALIGVLFGYGIFSGLRRAVKTVTNKIKPSKSK